MRLIDADNLSKNIAKWCMGGDPQETEMVKLDEILFQVVDEIEKQPTAYDVEKVEEKLQKKREYYYLNDDVYDPIAVDALDYAIDEVRKGGD